MNLLRGVFRMVHPEREPDGGRRAVGHSRAADRRTSARRPGTAGKLIVYASIRAARGHRAISSPSVEIAIIFDRYGGPFGEMVTGRALVARARPLVFRPAYCPNRQQKRSAGTIKVAWLR